MAAKKISASAARRIALAAQGFHRPRPGGTVDAGHLRRQLRNLGVLQLDFVNVLVPAHLLVMFSRLGPFEQERFHRAVYRGRQFTEQWAHEASIVPMELWPLLAHRREDYKPYPGSPINRIRNKSKYLQEAIEITQEKGPVTSADLPRMDGPRRRPGDWHRSLPRWALEYHFGKGNVAVVERLPNFQRVYDTRERVIRPDLLDAEPSRGAAQRELLRIAANALGIATLNDLADYFRMSPREAGPRVAELQEAGELIEADVEGWKDPAFLAPGARRPRAIKASRLLSPFDPLVWFRPRTERLFDFHYRIEIYVPKHKRKWGYYVLPFLLDEAIVARVDLKAERKSRCLQVLACHGEPGIDPERVAAPLASELRLLCEWLKLDSIQVERRGSLAQALKTALKTTSAPSGNG